MADRDSLINQMMSITGSDSVSAISTLLENHNWDLQSAVQTHLHTTIPSPQQNRKRKGQWARISPAKRAKTEHIPNIIEETDEFIPAPLPIRRERLIDAAPPPPSRPIRKIRAPFTTFSNKASNGAKEAALGKLFQRPTHLIFNGTFEELKLEAQKQHKWILINILDNDDFQCHCMNRDIWSNIPLRKLIEENFLFWQVDVQLAEKYQRFYATQGFPHTAVLHPTGEQRLFHSGSLTIQEVTNGLNFILDDARNPYDASYKPPCDFDGIKRKIELTEEEQFALAIQASLKEDQCVPIDVYSSPDSPSFPFSSEESEEERMEENDVIILSDTVKESPQSKIEINIDLEAEEEVLSTKGEAKGYLDPKEATCTVRIRLPEKGNIQGYFHADDLVQDIYDFLTCHADCPEELKSSCFELYTFPRRVLSEEIKKQNLKEADLTPRSVLMISQK